MTDHGNSPLSRLRAWFGADPSPSALPPAQPAPHEALEDLREWMVREVAAGFTDPGEIVEAAGEVFEGELDSGVARAEAERLLPELLAAHEREQESWPASTDNDRLDAAFRELEDAGIVCRQHFSCCNNCGSAEIWEEVDAARDIIPDVRGYIFYHMQDTEAAVQGGGLYLSYGAVSDTEGAAAAIAHDVTATINQHGLRADWNGDVGKRIFVPLDWKRRRAA